MRKLVDFLVLPFLWIVTAVLAALAAFQIHTSLMYIGTLVVKNPQLRPLGWSMDSLYGVSRVLWLLLGTVWLGVVMFLDGYYREGKEVQLLGRRVLIVVGGLAGIYIFSYLCLLILS